MFQRRAEPGGARPRAHGVAVVARTLAAEQRVAAGRRHVGGHGVVPQLAEFEMFFPRDAHAVHEKQNLDRLLALLHRRHMKALRPRDLLVTVDAAALVAPLSRRGLAVPGRGHEYNPHLAAGAGHTRDPLFDLREAGLLPRRRFFHRTCACPLCCVRVQTLRRFACVETRLQLVVWRYGGRGTTGSDAGARGQPQAMYPQLPRRNGSCFSQSLLSPKLGFCKQRCRPGPREIAATDLPTVEHTCDR